ncbi:MAG: CoA pyrophosphatase [Pirellulales bacterium]|nr:CoA pyrophosphatase [Pirellulales bacterium]
MNPHLPACLAERLRHPLPGAALDERFSPRPNPWPDERVIPAEARPAAVLILLYPREDAWHIPLILRPTDSTVHSGQICFPGGAVEPGETTAAAAVREFHEELGDDGTPLELLGTLSPWHVRASNYLITPWIGCCAVRPRFTPNPVEVAEYFEVPLTHFLDPANFSSHDREFRGNRYRFPHFAWAGRCVWGATCRILGELVTILLEKNVL